ncbi:MAG: hypothetical protein ABI776_05790 [Nocardioidaceae bacterium]
MLRRVLPWLAFAVLVGVAVATAGWGSGGTATPDPARPSTAPSRTPSDGPTSLSSPEAQSLVHNIGLGLRDLPPGFVRDRAGTRTALDEDASLDLCAASYPSESFRLAAHSVVYVAPDGRRVRTRVIAYEHGVADLALGELRRAAPSCTRPVRPRQVQQPGTLALRVRATGSLNRAARHEVVVERREDVLVLLDTDGTTGPFTFDLARLLSLRLLAQLPDA